MKNIKNLRINRGMSQRELARLLNITQQSVHKYETGKANPSMTVLRELSEIFHTSIEFLTCEEDEDYTAKQIVLSSDEYELIENYRKLPVKTKAFLRNASTKLASTETNGIFY